jgi:hypothetical protein
VFFTHAYQPVVRRDHKETVVGAAGHETEGGSSQVSLVTGEIRKCDNFGTSPPNLLPRQFPPRCIGHDDLSSGVEAHDLHTDGTGSAGLDLVLVSKQAHTGAASPVIEVTFDEHAEHGTLPGVDIPDYSDTGFNDVFDLFGTSPNQHLSTATGVLCRFGLGADGFDISAHIPGQEQLTVGFHAFGNLHKTTICRIPLFQCE